MSKPIIIVGVLWIATAIGYSIWRVRGSNLEAMPIWLRFLLSAAILSVLWPVTTAAKNAPTSATGGLTQLYALALVMVSVLAVFVIWHRDIFALFASPLTSLYDGGHQELIAKPFYSRALALRKRGEPENALEEIQSQLRLFPNDTDGWLLWAEVQSDDLKDPAAAIETLHAFLARDGATPEQRMLASQREADLFLFKLEDRAAAKVVLERLVAEFPGTDGARLAAQRLAHMPEAEHLAEARSRERKKLTVVHHEEKLGLTEDLGASQLAGEGDLDAEISGLVVHLAEHPDDWERRERLAKLYSEHLERPDLAHEQLERLVLTPGQPDRQVARWLNQIADIHLEESDGLPAARLALERIQLRFPGGAAAQLAGQRLALLKLEMRGDKPTRTLKIGKYSDRMGLEGQGPHRPLRARLPDLAPDPEANEDSGKST